MPEEVFNVDTFVRLSARAKYCSVKRLSNTVKLKLRTSRKIYTYKVDPSGAESIVKKLQCEIVEV